MFQNMFSPVCTKLPSSTSLFSPKLDQLYPLTLLLLTVCVPRSFAQAVFGSVIGTVTDPTGAVVPNATIVVTDVSKGTTETVQSNGSGNDSASRLLPDTYTAKAAAQGFNQTT